MPQRKPKRRAPTTPAAGKRSGQAAGRGATAATEQNGSRVNWTKLAIQGAVVAVVAAFIYFIASGVGSELSGVPDGVQAVAVNAPEHVEGEIDYDGHPAGGEHNAQWLNCGFYSAPVAEENAVHSLEHGAVWITYPLGADPGVVDRLAGYAGRSKVLVSPVDGQAVPIIVTSWGNQMEVEEPDDARIAQYIVEFAGAASAPEPGGACTGGVGVPG